MQRRSLTWLLWFTLGIGCSACASLGDPPPLRTGVIAGSTQYNKLPELDVLTQLTTPRAPGVVRFVSYNVEKNSAFEPGSPQQPRFARLVAALDADIYALQEVYDTPSQVVSWFNQQAPLADGATWYAFEGGSTMTVSRFPKLHHQSNTVPDSGRKVSLTFLDLPDTSWPQDLYLINLHMSCCDSGELMRQRQADSLVAWLRRLRANEGPVPLKASTPVVMLGDLNLVGGQAPLETLLTGDINDEATWGQDTPTDGDGTSLLDLKPSHNGDGLAQWTWRNDAGPFAPGRLDYGLVTDSVLLPVASAVVNTTTMSEETLTALGLQRLDVGKFPVKGGWALDHLPLVIDLRYVAPNAP